MALKAATAAMLAGTRFDALDAAAKAACVADLLAEPTPACQRAAFLALLTRDGETADTVDCFVTELLGRAHACPLGATTAACDIVGTGGDGKNTFNISTPASMVAAAMGLAVAKHGNRSASASSGSADVAEHLGGCLTLSPEQVAGVVERTGYCFVFAPMFHPALKPLVTVRKELGFKTVFNLLGPLLNPTDPRFMVVGVGSRAVVDTLLGALGRKPNLRCLVVHSEDGMDKISPRVPTHTWLLESGKETVYSLVTPEDFGLSSSDDASYYAGGGGPVDNAATICKVLDGSLPGGLSDFVLVQAAALAVVAGKAATYKEGMELARQAVASGVARRKLDEYVRVSTHAGKGKATDILSRILKRRRVDLALAREQRSLDNLKAAAAAAPKALDLFAKFADVAAVGVAAELKRASPSEGDISTQDLLPLAAKYADAGVQVISVLTEPVWFKGSLDDLEQVRGQVASLSDEKRPAVLRKDFIVSKYQVLEARARGADTLLLIVAATDTMAEEGETLAGLIAYCREWGMEPLVEVVAEAEVDAALAAGARVIGVNNRDLKTFKVDLNRTGDLLKYAKDTHGAEAVEKTRWVGLSGVSTVEHVKMMKGQGAAGVLVGTSLMRAEDPKAMIEEWRQ